MAQSFSIGIDIGGSHICGAMVNDDDELITNSYENHSIDPALSKNEFAGILTRLVENLLKKQKDQIFLSGIGLSVPGPFLYQKGIATLEPQKGKLFNLFGLHVPSLFYPFFGEDSPNVTLLNDAECFGLGSLALEEVKQHEKVLAITLGTGLGSVFLQNNEVLKVGFGMPDNGYLYNQPFSKGIADDYFSTRGILNRFYLLQPHQVTDALAVSELARQGNEAAKAAFISFGLDLATFLSTYLSKTDTHCLVIGGSIAKSADLFLPAMEQFFQKQSMAIKIVPVCHTTDTIIKGAVGGVAKKKSEASVQQIHKRKAKQPIAPRKKIRAEMESYTIYPAMSIGENRIHENISSLVPHLLNEKVIVLDGYGGVDWDDLVQKFNHAFSTHHIQPLWICADAALKTEKAIRDMLSNHLGGLESIFGKRYKGELSDFFDEKKLNQLRPDNDACCILYGTGAALASWNAPIIYAELPKNEIQFRMRAGALINLGCSSANDPKLVYKQLYFVDWPVLNRHKERILRGINYLMDVQDPQLITWIHGSDFQDALTLFTKQAFRARPWFEPGVWGGQWMKRQFPELSRDEINYAWSFELITPENGLTIESNNLLLEISFDCLMFRHGKEILGDAYKIFGSEFPIRFDFLDTWQGDNLSIQCHPSNSYISEHFGENFTQDETYYILDCTHDAGVYLGFQEDIEAGPFEEELKNSYSTNTPLQIEKYVQCLPAQKHDLFLIPNCTIHGAGAGNLVLEISSTPYIFTFKLYDWLRPDLDGKPRPINIEHGMKNLDFSRKGNSVQETLISKPVLLEEGVNWKRFSLPTHREHFYAIERYEFSDSIEISGNNQCHILMLVKGHRVTVCTQNGMLSSFHYAETFVVPASTGNYRIKNMGSPDAMLVVAFVKPSF